jgi:hypothetical protein
LSKGYILPQRYEHLVLLFVLFVVRPLYFNFTSSTILILRQRKKDDQEKNLKRVHFEAWVTMAVTSVMTTSIPIAKIIAPVIVRHLRVLLPALLCCPDRASNWSHTQQ